MGRYRRFVFGLSAVAIALISGCGNGPPASTGSGGGGSAPSVGTSGAQLGTPDVKLQAGDDLKFTPGSVTAKVGQVVQWTNAGTVTHNITFSGNAASVSDTSFNSGDVWQVKFTKAGTYSYQCTIHAGMTGTITVS